MSRLQVFRGQRRQLSKVARMALPAAAVGIAIAVPAAAASAGSPVSGPAQPGGARPNAAPPMIAPLAAPVRPADLAAAAATCAQYATRAGWANNGYYAGDLVTATAVCLGESAGDPKLYTCDENGNIVGHGDF